MYKYVIVIPTLNAATLSHKLDECIRSQSCHPSDWLIIDSESEDDTVKLFEALGAKCFKIPRESFNHGATRQLALSYRPDADIIIYLTQDSILASTDSIKSIIACFDDKKVGAACGHQLPFSDASPIVTHARLFNYPAVSSVKSIGDIPSMGIKSAFLSNSFAAYRRIALVDTGGFPSDIIFGEDTYVAAKMLLSGWKIVYCAEATCYHSHNYSVLEEFERYFDIGVFHSREKWFIESLGKPKSEGMKFVISELRYLLKKSPWLIPSALLRTGLKLLGYKIGYNEKSMPLWLKRKLSMNKKYWIMPN